MRFILLHWVSSLNFWLLILKSPNHIAAIGPGLSCQWCSALLDEAVIRFVVNGDLNWNWLHLVSGDFKGCCVSLNLFQMIESLTRANLKCPETVSLIDVILNTVPHKYTLVFANDISDHCAVGRNTEFPKNKPKANPWLEIKWLFLMRQKCFIVLRSILLSLVPSMILSSAPLRIPLFWQVSPSVLIHAHTLRGHKGLKILDLRKSFGPDNLETHFLKLAAPST